MGPQQKEFQREIQQTKQVGVGAPTKRISARNSTDKASWGSGPQQREFQREIQQTKQVGVGE
ncbi:hypothetical protein [Staphylococcus epidermidis]|uniref:hypothetical protein n=1 Tax=Staphylococcus epidermidis TaxID=1282 RepID=UPI001E3A2C70|nr:hypothetical protein [Staphylococcus epidermidis]MDH9402423.1 hypothetical protein [Staphylococcus epidermidis]